AGAGAAVGIVALPNASGVAVVLCALFAGTRLVISWFPMDAPGADPTVTGRRHGQLAMSAFVSVGIAAATLSRVLRDHHADGSLAGPSGALAAVMLVALVAMALDRRAGGGHFGLAERCFYAAMTAWLVVVAVLVATA
ncbi:MAG: DUF998 domain-containing protein, partial [Acidimicrobiales bacterium]